MNKFTEYIKNQTAFVQGGIMATLILFVLIALVSLSGMSNGMNHMILLPILVLEDALKLNTYNPTQTQIIIAYSVAITVTSLIFYMVGGGLKLIFKRTLFWLFGYAAFVVAWVMWTGAQILASVFM